MADGFYCEKCNRTKSAEEFYSSNNLEKYPNEGKLHQCKKCLTMHVDNWNPDTYLWILQEIDVPYIPDEWNKLMASYANGNKKLSGMTILGRYLSKMKLKQFRDFRWKDNDFLQEMANNKIEQAMKRQGYGAAEIADAINKATFTLPEEIAKPPEVEEEVNLAEVMPMEDYFDDGATDSLVAELTDEDRLYLRLKWGKAYKPDEWIELEKLYNEMMESYDIQTAGHKDTLKLICKTSLKANQLIDMGDIEGYQKMSKVYDTLMKSGKFTAAQNKAATGEYVDSISELVALCERDGFIPRYYTDGPQDKVDRTLQDLQNYTRTLVTEEMNLGNLIESAIKQIQIDKEKEADMAAEAAGDEDAFDASLFGDGEESILTDEDFSILRDLEEQAGEDDDEFLEKIINGEIL